MEFPKIKMFAKICEACKMRGYWEGKVTSYNWDVSTLDDSGDVGYAPYITVDHNDIVHISYYDAGNGALKYAVGN